MLRRPDPVLLKDVAVRQVHKDGSVRVRVSLHTHCEQPVETTATLLLDGQTVTRDVTLYPGWNRTDLTVRITAPRLWWPVGHGAQPLYDLQVRIGETTRQMRIGLREIALIETFTEPGDGNVSSAVMDVHQHNRGGNSRIVETLARNFRFPDGFDEMCWLSQVSQGLAMKTAVEFWRSSKPRSIGTLYWQLNDTWPVASWASLEYGGAWKLTQYMARRFYAPVLVTAQPEGNEVVILAVNDTPGTVSLSVAAMRIDVTGPMQAAGDWACICPPDRAVEVARLPAALLGAQEILHLRWRDVERRHAGENEYWPNRPKGYALPEPQITCTETDDGVRLETDRPAFFVTQGFGGADIWSDNCFTLLPGTPRLVQRVRRREGLAGAAHLRWLKG